MKVLADVGSGVYGRLAGYDVLAAVSFRSKRSGITDIHPVVRYAGGWAETAGS
jgi:hypothetical protein